MFCCCLKQKIPLSEQGEFVSEKDEANDLATPEVLNSELEYAIASWQAEISEQIYLEERIVEKYWPSNPDIVGTIEDIRSMPSEFINSPDLDFSKLALKVISVMEMKTKIDDFSNAHGTIPSFKPSAEETEIVTSPAPEECANDMNEVAKLSIFQSRWMKILANGWAGRLEKLVPTQGVLRQTSSNNLEDSELKVKPTWPDWLVDVTYAVVKRNRFGRKQRRLLKLTQYHVLLIRHSIEISKSFKYKDINSLALLDAESFVVKFCETSSSKARNIKFFSSMSPYIVQQITTRMQVTKALDKSGYSKDHTIPDSLVGYSVGTTVLLIEAILGDSTQIKNDSAKESISDLVSFAKGLGERAIFHSNSQFKCGSSLGRHSGGCTDLRSVWSNEDANRLIAFKENSVEIVAQHRVQSILHGDDGPEKRTRNHFVETFDGRDPVDIRHFVDGMFDYIIEKRGIEIGQIFYQSTARLEDLSELDKKLVAILAFIVFTVVEESIFVALKHSIVNFFSTPEKRVLV